MTEIFPSLKDVYPPYLQQLGNRESLLGPSSKTKMKNSYNYYHITMKKTCLSPSEMQKNNRIVFMKEIMSLERISLCTNDCSNF